MKEAETAEKTLSNYLLNKKENKEKITLIKKALKKH